MSEDEFENDPFPDWGKPATKGDVIQAMIYLRALTTASLKLARAYGDKDPEAITKAQQDYMKERAETDAILEEISGRKADNE